MSFSSHTARALLAYNGSVFLFAAMFGLCKYLSDTLSTFEIMFFRCIIALIPISFIIFIQCIKNKSLNKAKAKKPLLLFLRCFFGSAAMLLTFYAYTLLPMATACTLIFTSVLWTIPLSVLLLGYKISAARTVATVIGFGGVLVMLTPQAGLYYGYMIALLCAFFQAVVTILLHKLGKTESPMLIVFYFMLTGSIISLIGMNTHSFNVAINDIPLLLTMGILGAAGQYLMSIAYRDAHPTLLSPFQYTSLIWSSVIGYVVWNDILSAQGWAGALIIIGSTVYLTLSERRRTMKIAQVEEKVFT